VRVLKGKKMFLFHKLVYGNGTRQERESFLIVNVIFGIFYAKIVTIRRKCYMARSQVHGLGAQLLQRQV